MDQVIPADFLASVVQAYIDRAAKPRGRFYDAATGSYTGVKEVITEEPGLSDSECYRVEEIIGTSLPIDLRQFLKFRLLVGSYFPDWRNDSFDNLKERAMRPVVDLIQEVRQGTLWLSLWGNKPTSLATAVDEAQKELFQAPKLVPIYANRYMVIGSQLSGNPVVSVMGTDIIYFGNDISDYFSHELGLSRPIWAANVPKQIEPWDSLVRMNDG